MFLIMTSMIENTVSGKENQVLTISEELIERIAKNDTDAFRQLYEETNKAVYGFAYSILKNPQDAQDILQDTYVHIHRAAGTYKSQGKPMAWIFTITRNLALMKIRRGKKTVELDNEQIANVSTHIDFSERSDNKIALLEALAQLPDDVRQIVVLHSVSGLKHREIAEIMDMALPTVLTKYNRALKKLRTIIQGGENS